MTKRNSLLAQIHIAKKELNMDDGDYRAFINRHTGKSSAGALNEKQLHALLDAFKNHGFKPKSKNTFKPKSNKPYVRLIYVLWKKLSDANVTHKTGLNKFVKSQIGVDSVEWLDNSQCQQIIEALKKWAKRKDVSLAK